MLSVAAITLALAGCSSEGDAAEGWSDWHSKSIRDLDPRSCTVNVEFAGEKRTIIESYPFCELQKGEAEWICDRGPRQPITSISWTGFLFSRCNIEENYSNTIRLCYRGEIDQSFLQLIELVERYEANDIADAAEDCQYYEGKSEACDRKPSDFVLVIDSPGGDVQAAIEAGRILTKRNWAVLVRQGNICTSACVFLLASAAERIVAGQVGIHRIIPVGSSVDGRGALDKELAPILGDARDLLEENGVSPRLLEDMMTVPSSTVRYLSEAELIGYGLGAENSAALDLRRIEIERKCGSDFVERMIAADALNEQCGGSTIGGDFGLYSQCVNAGYAELGFPDKRCPDDGPSFICVPPQPRSELDFETSKERCK